MPVQPQALTLVMVIAFPVRQRQVILSQLATPMFIPAFSVLFIALIGLCGTFALVLLPVFPQSIWAKAIWVAFLALMSWIFVTEMVIPVEFGAWHTPLRSTLVQGLIFFSPFVVSIALWRRSLKRNRPTPNEFTLFTVIAITCAASFFGLQFFNKTCLSVTEERTVDRVWCTSKWQVQKR